MDKFDIFAEIPNLEMKKLYEDILQSREEGLRPLSLDPFVTRLKEICCFESTSDAIQFAQDLFYKEVAKRYFCDK